LGVSIGETPHEQHPAAKECAGSDYDTGPSCVIAHDDIYNERDSGSGEEKQDEKGQ
jgi:hypothetical protein